MLGTERGMGSKKEKREKKKEERKEGRRERGGKVYNPLPCHSVTHCGTYLPVLSPIVPFP